MYVNSEDIEVPTARQKEEFFDQLHRAVGNTIADCLPPIALSQPGPFPDASTDNFLSLEHLVELRRAHDTNLAQKAVRTATSRAEGEDSLARRDLIKVISDVVNERDVTRPSTGLNRITRWTGTGQAGNAANAAAAAATRAAQVSHTHVVLAISLTQISLYFLNSGPFNSHCSILKAPLPEVPAPTRFQCRNPAQHSSCARKFWYCFRLRTAFRGPRYVSTSFFILRTQFDFSVISIYKKMSEKHAWIPEATTIGEISYIAVQAYEQSRGRLFSMTHATIPGRIRGSLFAHVPPVQFIALLPGSDQAKKGGDFVELTESSFAIWKEICCFRRTFPKLIKESRKRRKNDDKEGEELGDEE